MIAPEGSVTVPVSAPVLDVCARTGETLTMKAAAIASNVKTNENLPDLVAIAHPLYWEIGPKSEHSQTMQTNKVRDTLRVVVRVDRQHQSHPKTL
jgi:hypothetical protein